MKFINRLTRMQEKWIGTYSEEIFSTLPVEFFVAFQSSSRDLEVVGTFRHAIETVPSTLAGERFGSGIKFIVSHRAPRSETGHVQVAFDGKYSADGDVIAGDWQILDGYFANKTGPWIMYREGSRAIKTLTLHRIKKLISDE